MKTYFYIEDKKCFSAKRKLQKSFAVLLSSVFFLGVFFLFTSNINAQFCNPGVPFFYVDLSSTPDSVWISPETSRKSNCCGTTSPNRCVGFEITLHPDAIAINFEIASGAIPPGALFYQVNCGPPVYVGEPICVTGPGPHVLTFCKPVNNPNTYAITSIPTPSTSPDKAATEKCNTSIWVRGLIEKTILWKDLTGGGVYESFLSCTTCSEPLVTPTLPFPEYVDYQVCGVPAGSKCLENVKFCDTVRVYFYTHLEAGGYPNPAYIDPVIGGVDLHGTHKYGVSPYSYKWYDEPDGKGNLVGTNTLLFATEVRTYSFVVYDALYPNCEPAIANIKVGGILPVTLLSFSAECNDKTIEITWQTASEINCDYFTIERSTDVKNWETIGTVKGAGYSNMKLSYLFTDYTPIKGISYYRLSQTDYDGTSETFNATAVHCGNISATGISIYPIPASEKLMVFSDNKINLVSFYNFCGNQIFEIQCTSNYIEVDIRHLSDGIYFILLNTEIGIFSEKIIISH